MSGIDVASPKAAAGAGSDSGCARDGVDAKFRADAGADGVKKSPLAATVTRVGAGTTSGVDVAPSTTAAGNGSERGDIDTRGRAGADVGGVKKPPLAATVVRTGAGAGVSTISGVEPASSTIDTTLWLADAVSNCPVTAMITGAGAGACARAGAGVAVSSC